MDLLACSSREGGGGGTFVSAVAPCISAEDWIRTGLHCYIHVYEHVLRIFRKSLTDHGRPVVQKCGNVHPADKSSLVIHQLKKIITYHRRKISTRTTV